MNDPPTTINEIIPVGETQRGDLNPAAVYVASLSQGSAQTGMTSALKRVAELVGSTPDELPWHQLRHSHVAALRTRLAELYAPATCNKMLSAIRGVVRQAWLLGLCTSEDAQLVAAVKNVRGSRLPAGRALTRAELVALFEACHDKYNIHAGLRDQACFAMLYGLGLRRAEAAAAKIEDYAADAGELRVIGKGGKERLAFVHGGAALAIDRWLEAAEAASTTGRVHILCPVRKGGTVVGHTGMAPNSLLSGWPSGRRRPGSRSAAPTTSGEPSSRRRSPTAPTWRWCRRWLAMRRRRRRRGTTGAGMRRNAPRRSS